MMNCFAEVCVGGFIVFFPAPKKAAPKPPPPRGFALRKGGRAVKSKSAGWEANASQELALASLGLSCFLLASGRRRQKTGKQTAQKKKKNVLYIALT
jgi:hypothetical protein